MFTIDITLSSCGLDYLLPGRKIKNQGPRYRHTFQCAWFFDHLP